MTTSQIEEPAQSVEASTSPPVTAPAPEPQIGRDMPRPAPVPAPEPARVEGDRSNFDAFAHEPPFRPRRNPAKLWTILAVVAAVLMLGAVAALTYFGTPKFNFGAAPVGQPVKIEGSAETQTLASGNQLLIVTGRVTNLTEAVQRVPQIRAELRDDGGRVVYDWAISAPVTELQPRQSAAFNSTEAGVPASAAKFRLVPAGTR